MTRSPATVWLYLDRIANLLIVAVTACVLWAVAPMLLQQRSDVAPVERLHDVSIAAASTDPASAGRLVLIEFSDFRCPFCRAYSRETLPKVRSEFVDTGRVLYDFRHSPLTNIHPDAFRMAEAAECAAQRGQFEVMRERLFGLAEEASEQRLADLAHEVGIDRLSFSQCLREAARPLVERDLNEAARLGIRATPTLLIGRISPDGSRIELKLKVSGAVPYAELKKFLESV